MNASDRFVKKSFNLDLATLNALTNYFENGGTITVCKKGRRTKANTTFPLIRGTVANMGAKSHNLINSGKAKGRKAS